MVGRIEDRPRGHLVAVLELDDDTLFHAASPLSRHAKSVVLEITERAPIEKIRDVGNRVAQLRALGYRIAVDDLGAGYAGLASFAHLEPEVVKVDMSLARVSKAYCNSQSTIDTTCRSSADSLPARLSSVSCSKFWIPGPCSCSLPDSFTDRAMA